MSTHDFFFSYRKSDANLVRNLANWCRSSGASVWLDEDSIPVTEKSGQPLADGKWREFVENGINGARHILLFTNEKWVNSDACRAEGEWALAQASHHPLRVLRICLGGSGDVDAAFPPLATVPKLSYLDERSFASFLLENCGVRLKPELCSALVADSVRNGVACNGSYLSIKARAFRSKSDGVLKRDPMRCLSVGGIEVLPHQLPLDVRISYSPFFKYVGFEGHLLQQTSHGPRIDEELQAAYRHTAIVFLAKHSDWAWFGTHQVWRNGICHFSLTYCIPPDHQHGEANSWVVERLFSMPWEQELERVSGEIHFTFRRSFPKTPELDALAVFHLEADAVFQSLEVSGRDVLKSLDRALERFHK